MKSVACKPWAFCILTFGCKVNQYETEALREAWQSQGGQENHDPAYAAVIVLNTCAITASAVSDVRQALRRVRRVNSTAQLVLTGCAAELPDQELAFLSDAVLSPVTVVRQADKATLLNWQFSQTKNVFLSPEGTASVSHARPPFPPFRIASFRRARPVLKVQDGCSHGCAYCIVPQTRGASCSRPLQETVAEARCLLEAGFREIMVSGINLRQYHDKGADFWDLLACLDAALAPEWAGRARLRISSVDPAQLTNKGLDTLAASRMVCPHLHLSLQSGSTAVLRAMNRGHYNPQQVLDAVDRMRDFWPRFGLGADILMGFPGETETHVQETLTCIAALPLSYAHVFPFSERPGTPAATMPGQIAKAERHQRAALVRDAVQGKHQAFLREQLAVPCLLLASDGDGSLRGVDEYYTTCELDARCGPAPPLTQSAHASSHELLAVRPVAIQGNVLLVSACM